jgi:hypothetical protein
VRPTDETNLRKLVANARKRSGEAYSDGALVVQRNELSSIPQSFFPCPAVAVAGNSIPLLPPFGEIDYVPLRLRRGFGGEDDLQ